jgi:hypothetical protein
MKSIKIPNTDTVANRILEWDVETCLVADMMAHQLTAAFHLQSTNRSNEEYGVNVEILSLLCMISFQRKLTNDKQKTK